MDLVNLWTTCSKALLAKTEKGSAFVEYIFVLVLIAVFCMVALHFLGVSTADYFSAVGNSVADT